MTIPRLRAVLSWSLTLVLAVAAWSRTAFAELGRDALPALAVGTGVAAVVGYASIAWFLRWLGSHELIGFAIYRIAAGLALLGALAARIVSA